MSDRIDRKALERICNGDLRAVRAMEELFAAVFGMDASVPGGIIVDMQGIGVSDSRGGVTDAIAAIDRLTAAIESLPPVLPPEREDDLSRFMVSPPDADDLTPPRLIGASGTVSTAGVFTVEIVNGLIISIT